MKLLAGRWLEDASRKVAVNCRGPLIGVALLGAAACAGGAGRPGPALSASPVLRVYDARAGRLVPFETMVDAAAGVDLVFFGEQHDDPVTHAAEAALLAAVGARRPNVVLSLEMFERDVQDTLNAYLAGRIVEATFLAAARPWERYATDYRAMIELARAHGWPVIAANVPRRLASAVSRAGLTVLDTLNAADRRWAAREHSCPRDDEYFTRFSAQMKEHGAGPSAPPDTAALRRMTERYYEAQCVKDEAMGEAMVDAWRRAGSGAIVLHYDGAFHSDFGLGTAERARRRAAGVRSLVISAVPVASLDSLPVDAHRRRADFVIFTRRVVAGTSR
jgi:uncharacterized iron-regulated protein